MNTSCREFGHGYFDPIFQRHRARIAQSAERGQATCPRDGKRTGRAPTYLGHAVDRLITVAVTVRHPERDMALDPKAVGAETEPLTFGYDWKTVVLYALGVGATRDELDYVYEGRGPKVLPTFGVVPAYEPITALIRKLDVSLDAMVHGSQELRVFRPIPAEGTFSTVARIEAVYDLRRLGQVVASTRSEMGGVAICETRWTLLFLEDGGFGGSPPPRQPIVRPAENQAPDWTHEQRTLPEQALLYRLSGDENPLHADPEFARRVGFERGPILHGLATFGFIGRTIVNHACGGDPSALRSLTAQFKKPVWPGETLRTQGYSVEDRLICRVSVVERDEAVVSNCVAQIGPVP